jgi:predicted dehydrogenase
MTAVAPQANPSDSGLRRRLWSGEVRHIGRPPLAAPSRITVVGLGAMGARHVSAALRSGHRIAALVDPHPEPVGVREHPTLAAMKVAGLSQVEPASTDVLVIATTAQFHFALTNEAIAAGFKRIVIEKPVTQSVAQAIELKERAARAGVRLTVNHGRRYCEAYSRVRDLKHDLGAVRSVTLRSGGGALGCVGTHWIDLATTLIDAEPSRVFAVPTQPASNPRGATFVDPGASVMITYANGAAAFIDTRDDVGFIGGLSISFTNGELTYTNEFAPWTLRKRLAADWEKPAAQYGLPLATTAFPPSAMAAVSDPSGGASYSGREAILAYASASHDDALGDHEPISGIDAAIQTMAVFAAARESMASGRAVEIDTLSNAALATIYPIP